MRGARRRPGRDEADLQKRRSRHQCRPSGSGHSTGNPPRTESGDERQRRRITRGHARGRRQPQAARSRRSTHAPPRRSPGSRAPSRGSGKDPPRSRSPSLLSSVSGRALVLPSSAAGTRFIATSDRDEAGDERGPWPDQVPAGGCSARDADAFPQQDHDRVGRVRTASIPIPRRRPPLAAPNEHRPDARRRGFRGCRSVSRASQCRSRARR